MPWVIGMILFSVASVVVFLIWRGMSSDGLSARRPMGGIMPTLSHDNIALAIGSRKLWVRDEDGHETVLEAADLVGWSVIHGTMQTRSVCWPNNVYLELKTRSVDKPIWRVRFKRYGEASPERRNRADCQEWSDCLDAL